MKDAKKGLLGKSKKTAFTEAIKAEGGLDSILNETQEVMDSLDAAARKHEEFPDDEDSNVDLEVAESNLDAIIYAGDKVVELNELGLIDSPKMVEMMEASRERRAYNQMWSEAKTLFMAGEYDELYLMFETIRESFVEIELEYNTAKNDKTANNMAEVKQLG